MYIPDFFHVGDLQTLRGFIRQHSFVTLVTASDELAVTHLPLVLRPQQGKFGTLVGHFARANPHHAIDHARRESVAIFTGPHAFVSPAWYRDAAPAVPTWNYTAVQAHGNLLIIEDHDRASAILKEIELEYEKQTSPPRHNLPPEDVHERMVRAIVAFEMPIDRLLGKFKLGQNRSLEDQLATIEGLQSTGDSAAIALAKLSRDRLGTR
jgi:transcriptional regulator